MSKKLDPHELIKRWDSIRNGIISDGSIGMTMCAVSLHDIFMNSETENRRYSRRYFQEGRLRAIAEIYKGTIHGEFLVFYPDGKLWMRGAYRNNSLVPQSMVIFMPDGTPAKGRRFRDNVIPFKPKNDSSL